jgi:hypothetical protein
VIETPEKYWLRWKEAEAHPDAGDNPLLRELGQLCAKERLLEIVHDFMVFDAGIKKICRDSGATELSSATTATSAGATPTGSRTRWIGTRGWRWSGCSGRARPPLN